MGNYPIAKIISKTGLATKVTDLNKYNGMLGISISNQFFSNKRVGAIAKLGSQLCKNFTIVIFDFPERWNWPIKQRVNLNENTKRCLMVGEEKYRAFLHELKKLNLTEQVSILRWKDIQEEPQYIRNLQIVSDEFSQNQGFSNDVLKQLNINLKVRLSKMLIPEEHLNTLSNYMLEEIAGLLYLYFDSSYSIDFYPSTEMEIMQNIYSGSYPNISSKLKYDWQKLGWVQVGF